MRSIGIYSQGGMFKSYIDRVEADGGEVKDLRRTYSNLSKLSRLGFFLITIPNAQKQGKLYSINPNDGEGDFTVSRNGQATYFDKDGLLKTVPNNFPRFQYDLLTKNFEGLLIENAATNLVRYSSQFSNSAWIKTGVNGTSGSGLLPIITDNYDISPSGENDATRVIFQLNGGTLDSDRSGFSLSQVVVSTNTPYYSKFFIKPLNVSIEQVMDNLNVFGVSVGGGTGTMSQSYKELSNGWYEVTRLREHPQSSVTFRFQIFGSHGIHTLDCLLYGAMLSVNSPSSYIPTLASQVTRPADIVSISNLKSKGFIGESTGTIYYEKDGIKMAEVYSGGNKLTYTSGVLTNTVVQDVPDSLQFLSGLYKVIASKTTSITESEALELTS